MTTPRLIAVTDKPVRRSIPFSVKQRIWIKPCAVCGIPWDIHVDHIRPVAFGGGSEESNLQPLCSGCNYIKGKRRTNADVAEVVAQRGLPYFLKAGYRHATRYVGPYDGPGLNHFAACYPDEYRLAVALHAAFLGDRTKC